MYAEVRFFIIVDIKVAKNIYICITAFLNFQDPYKNFGLPAVGRLHTYKEPTHISNVNPYNI